MYSHKRSHASDAHTIWNGSSPAVMTCTYESASRCILSASACERPSTDAAPPSSFPVVAPLCDEPACDDECIEAASSLSL